MINVVEELSKLQDKEYALFQEKLTPGLNSDCFIGVRVPVLREFAKEFAKTNESVNFLNNLPHKYYDENMLHSILLTKLTNYEEALSYVDKFLPYVDNWAVCDTLSPKAFKKNTDKLINEIYRWTNSNKTYTIRFGIEMLMSFYLDDNFKEEYLNIVTNIHNDEYYVKMMQAWYMSFALIKQWDLAIKIIENGILDKWVHNKSIQKAIESYRISDDKKQYLRTLRK